MPNRRDVTANPEVIAAQRMLRRIGDISVDDPDALVLTILRNRALAVVFKEWYRIHGPASDGRD